MADVTKQTPVQIDTELARLFGAQERAGSLLACARDALKRGQKVTADLKARYPKEYGPDFKFREETEAEAAIAEQTRVISKVRDAIRPLTAEFERRPWSRFFLVLNGNGHCHSSRSCSTCFPTTRYAWVTALSGATEDEAVREYGEKMCTICFPSAPVSKFWGEGRVAREEREAKDARKAERDAKRAAQDAAAVIDPATGRPLFKTERAARNELSSQVEWVVSSERHRPREADHAARLAELALEYREKAMRVARPLGLKLGVSPESLFDEYYAKKEAAYRKRAAKDFAEAIRRGFITAEQAEEDMEWLKQKGYL